MENRGPIQLLPGQRHEGRPKPGGGNTPSPLVELSNELMGSMQTQISSIARTAQEIQPLTGDSVPLAILLRPAALAKSKRPSALLKKLDLHIAAAGKPGELVAEVDSAGLRRLESAFDAPTSKADQYDVSTFSEFSIWHPLLDTSAFGQRAGENPVAAAAEQGKRLRLDFFPWLSLNTPLLTGEILSDYLENAGYNLRYVGGDSRRISSYFEVTRDTEVDALNRIWGIRAAVVAPEYLIDYETQSPSTTAPATVALTLNQPPSEGRPVGVLDSGITPGLLAPWTDRRYTYDIGVDHNPSHGTFVAGLIAASRHLNGDDRFPSDFARVVDAQVLPNRPISEDLLLDRIDEVLGKEGPDGPRVWNCSFAAQIPLRPFGYSPFAQFMDQMSAKHNVLFVQAAGNYVDPPGRPWPPTAGLLDGIASPADAVRSATVGSLSHNGGSVPAGTPASYSRRGPSFGGQQKPDLVHFSGDFTTYTPTRGVLGGHGIHSLATDDGLREDVGTSFATPIVSAVAANIWDKIEQSSGSMAASPELVKGLLVHTASLSSGHVDPSHRYYYGAGVPASSEETLGNEPHVFTTVHDVRLSRGVDWLKTPFPVPACLLTHEGKLRAEITMTVAYSPLVDPAFGEESVRTSVDASFGRILPGKNGPNIDGMVPLERATHAWEAQQVAEGKWSPIRTHRAKFPVGHQGGDGWGLRLSLLERAEEELQQEQRVFVILTMRGLEPDLPVYQDGLAAIAQCGYAGLDLDIQQRVTLEGDV